MKKLLGIVVLGLLLSGNVNAKEIWLDCLFRAKAGHTGFVHSFIINEKEKTILKFSSFKCSKKGFFIPLLHRSISKSHSN